MKLKFPYLRFGSIQMYKCIKNRIALIGLVITNAITYSLVDFLQGQILSRCEGYVRLRLCEKKRISFFRDIFCNFSGLGKTLLLM